jgi:hypothetical protein
MLDFAFDPPTKMLAFVPTSTRGLSPSRRGLSPSRRGLSPSTRGLSPVYQTTNYLLGNAVPGPVIRRIFVWVGSLLGATGSLKIEGMCVSTYSLDGSSHGALKL